MRTSDWLLTDFGDASWAGLAAVQARAAACPVPGVQLRLAVLPLLLVRRRKQVSRDSRRQGHALLGHFCEVHRYREFVHVQFAVFVQVGQVPGKKVRIGWVGLELGSVISGMKYWHKSHDHHQHHNPQPPITTNTSPTNPTQTPQPTTPPITNTRTTNHHHQPYNDHNPTHPQPPTPIHPSTSPPTPEPPITTTSPTTTTHPNHHHNHQQHRQQTTTIIHHHHHILLCDHMQLTRFSWVSSEAVLTEWEFLWLGLLWRTMTRRQPTGMAKFFRDSARLDDDINRR